MPTEKIEKNGFKTAGRFRHDNNSFRNKIEFNYKIQQIISFGMSINSPSDMAANCVWPEMIKCYDYQTDLQPRSLSLIMRTVNVHVLYTQLPIGCFSTIATEYLSVSL